MAQLQVDHGALRVRLSPGEQAASLRGADLTMPVSLVRTVRVVGDGLTAARGLGAPGLGVPGVRTIGTRRSRGRRTFVSVRRGQPAVLVRMQSGGPWDALLIGVDAPEAAAAALVAALPATRREEFVTIDPAADSLHGSLRVPGDGPQPAALLLAGSGPIDRDGGAPGMPLDIQLALAESLAEAGIASLRFDRRGIGDGTDWRAVSLHQNTADAAAALRFLAADPRIDADRLAVIGHSEGSVHALRLAVGEQRPAAAVLLSCPARPGGDVLLWQAEQIAPGLPKPAQAIIKVARIDVTAKTRAAHERLRATTTDVARLNGAKVNAAWFREFLDDDPREQLRALAVPTLALTGTADLQTPPQDAAAIAELAPGPVDVVQPEQVSHLLRRDPSPVPTLQDYRRQLHQPMDPAVLSTVTDWVVRHLGG